MQNSQCGKRGEHARGTPFPFSAMLSSTCFPRLRRQRSPSFFLTCKRSPPMYLPARELSSQSRNQVFQRPPSRDLAAKKSWPLLCFPPSPELLSTPSKLSMAELEKKIDSETQKIEDVDAAEATPVHTLAKLDEIVVSSTQPDEDAKDEHSGHPDFDSDVEKASLDLPAAHIVTPEHDEAAELHRVSFENPYHPTKWSPVKRWGILTIYCTLQVLVTLMSTEYISLEYLIKQKWPAQSQKSQVSPIRAQPIPLRHLPHPRGFCASAA